jgi:hypothetical protein
MKPSLVKCELLCSVRAGRPAFLWGPPGVGKSMIVRQVSDLLYAAEYGLKVDGAGRVFCDDGAPVPSRPYLVDLRAVLLDPVDLRGIPSIVDGRTRWHVPEFFPRSGRGMLFLDEVNAAPPLVQAALYQLVLDRRLGEYLLPDGWSIMAAGNRETDRAVVSRMSTALGSRFGHVDVDVDVPDWIAWALGAGLAPEVIAFIRWRGMDLLHAFDPAKNLRTFPCPRTWEFVSDFLKVGPSPEFEFELYSGLVGEGAASEFVGFLRIYRRLPDPRSIIKGPATAPVPAESEVSVLYALTAALSRLATVDNFAAIVQYADRLPGEFGVVLVRDAEELHPEIKKTRAYVDWHSAHSEIYV